MTVVWIFLIHHALWLVSLAGACLLFPSVLRERRPTGSVFAWLLALALLPYLGIVIYLIFGGRKLRMQAAAKDALRLGAPREAARGSSLEAVLSEDIPGAVPLEALAWLDDGERAFQALLEAIAAARTSIRIVTYVLGNDAAGRAILAALTKKAAAGVAVHLLIDALLFYQAPRDALAAFKAAGGRVARFMPVLHWPFRGRANLRNHRKAAIFDGQRAMLGGMNLAEHYLGPVPLRDRWRDLDVFIEGPQVTALDTIFRSDWRFAAGESLTSARDADASTKADRGGPLAQIVPSGPDRRDDSLYDVILQAIFDARARVWIATPYFAPDDPLVKALTLACRRGVDVRIVVPRRSNQRLADLVGASFLVDLAAAGADVRRYLPSMLHAKALVIDDTLAVVGSANFDMRSLYLDFETALLLYGAEPTTHLAGWFEATCAKAERGAPTTGRVGSWLRGLSRLLAPQV